MPLGKKAKDMIREITKKYTPQLGKEEARKKAKRIFYGKAHKGELKGIYTPRKKKKKK